MKYGVLHVNSSGANSTSPTMRIARFVASELHAPLIHNQETADEYIKTKFDVLFVKYGILRFSNHRDGALKIHNNAKMIVNLVNDYTLAIDARFNKFDEEWGTVEGKTRYVNFNILTRKPLEAWNLPVKRKTVTQPGIIYYGAHRDDRVNSFIKYFKGASYPVTLMTFRGKEKFLKTCGRNVTVLGANDGDPDFPTAWPMTVYIEDETSHRLFTSPATRFYECLQMGLAQAIDFAALPTLAKAGIEVPPQCVVNNQRDVKVLLPNWQKVYALQQKWWWRDYGAILRQQFWDAMKVSFNETRRNK